MRFSTNATSPFSESEYTRRAGVRCCFGQLLRQVIKVNQTYSHLLRKSQQ